MITRKPNQKQNVETLRNEMEIHQLMLDKLYAQREVSKHWTLEDAGLEKEHVQFIKSAKKVIAAFYAPATVN